MIHVFPDGYVLAALGFAWGWGLRPIVWDNFLKPILKEARKTSKQVEPVVKHDVEAVQVTWPKV